MQSNELSLMKIKLNHLWKKLERSRNLNVKPTNLLKIRTEIYNTQDAIANYVIKNKLDKDIVYRRKQPIDLSELIEEALEEI